MKALDKQALTADRAAVTALLERIPQDDPIGRLSFETRLAEINERLVQLQGQSDHLGSVALLFNGQPVRGSRSVDADFASEALRNFQDLVSKRVALEHAGELAPRGPLPLNVRSNLAITAMMRGSVGFVLEEDSVNETLADSAVKQAIDEVTQIIEKTASEDFAAFDDAVQSLDHRLLISLRAFFRNLDDAGAQVRIVEGEHDSFFDALAVRRARDRVENTEISEREDDTIVGELLGLLPEAKRFEMRLAVGREVVRGTVIAQAALRYMELIEQPDAGIVGRWWRVRMKIREVREPNKPPRQVFTLVGLIQPVDAPQP